MTQAKIVKQCLHQRYVTWITDRAVVERANFAFERVAKCAETARSVECFIGYAVEREFFTLFKSWNLGQLAVYDGFTWLDIFIDQTICAPGQVVVESI
ncbi:hypothetical protein D3C80_1928920 [compost metagenome]